MSREISILSRSHISWQNKTYFVLNPHSIWLARLELMVSSELNRSNGVPMAMSNNTVLWK